MSNSEFEATYPTIRAVVRWRRPIPPICAVAALAIVATAYPTPSGVTGGVLAAACVWGLIRLGVEIVEVIADTLLPK